MDARPDTRSSRSGRAACCGGRNCSTIRWLVYSRVVLPGRHHGTGPGHAGGEATDRLGVPFVSRPRCAPDTAEGTAVEHLAGGGDRRARGLRRVGRYRAHGPLGADAGRPPRSGPCRLPGHLVQGMADWVACGQTVRYLPFIPGSRFSPLLMAGHARSRTGRRRSPPGGGDGGAGGRPDRNPARRPPSPSPRRLLGVEVGAAEPGARHRLDEARLPRGVGRRQRREQLAWVIPSANQ
jgi:hypothetical protein